MAHRGVAASLRARARRRRRRSNNELDCTKLKALYPQLHGIKEAVELVCRCAASVCLSVGCLMRQVVVQLFIRMKAKMPADAKTPIPGVTPAPQVATK